MLLILLMEIQCSEQMTLRGVFDAAEVSSKWHQFIQDDFKPILERQHASAQDVNNSMVSDIIVQSIS
jgi:hypothetical protein